MMRFTDITRRQASRSYSPVGWEVPAIPALFTAIRNGPRSSSARATISATPSGPLTSAT